MHAYHIKTQLSFLRAEVLAAVVSVILIWLLAAMVLYEAIQRIINNNYDINADIMLITAAFGLLINILLVQVYTVSSIEIIIFMSFHFILRVRACYNHSKIILSSYVMRSEAQNKSRF